MSNRSLSNSTPTTKATEPKRDLEHNIDQLIDSLHGEMAVCERCARHDYATAQRPVVVGKSKISELSLSTMQIPQA